MQILIPTALKISKMETFVEKVTSGVGDVILHIIKYPNGSIFVWVTPEANPQFEDFHVATPTDFSSIPAVTTRIGDSESTGRFVALRLSKRLGVPVVVSWSLGDVVADEFSAIESEVFSILKKRAVLV